MMTILYHATDSSRVGSILKDGFICKPNDAHWLGNGIYFYLDHKLAEWWATNPTNKFGVDIKESSILQAELEIDESHTMDLRTLKGYVDCLDAYEEFSELTIPFLDIGVCHDRRKLRCAYFDWVFKTYEIDYIIGSFTHDNQAYLKSKSDTMVEQFRLFDLRFVETQVCVRQELIRPSSISICN